MAALGRTISRRSFITGPRFTPVVQSLPSIVPFVAPEEIERSRGKPFAVRLGVARTKPRVGVRDRRFERAFDES